MRFSKFMAAMVLSAATVGVMNLPGCSTAPETPAQTADLNTNAMSKLQIMENDDASVTQLVKSSYAYALLPEVGKGAVGIEAGGGRGVVYLGEPKQYWGTTQVQMGGIGLSLGGETYTELLIFQSKESFDAFSNAGMKFDTAASATIIQAGVTAKPTFQNGVAVLIRNTKGAMFDASIGGQQFTVKPEKVVPTAAPAMPTTGPAM